MKVTCQHRYFADALPGNQYAFIFWFGNQSIKMYSSDPNAWEVGKDYEMTIDPLAPVEKVEVGNG